MDNPSSLFGAVWERDQAMGVVDGVLRSMFMSERTEEEGDSLLDAGC